MSVSFSDNGVHWHSAIAELIPSNQRFPTIDRGSSDRRQAVRMHLLYCFYCIEAELRAKSGSQQVLEVNLGKDGVGQ